MNQQEKDKNSNRKMSNGYEKQFIGKKTVQIFNKLYRNVQPLWEPGKNAN